MHERLQAWGHERVVPIASALIFGPGNELLLLRRHSDDLGGDMWGFPGGRLEPGEDARATVLREVREETGLSLGGVKLLGVHEVSMPHGRVQLTSFLSRVGRQPEIVLDPFEHSGYHWFDVDEIATTRNLVWGIPTILHQLGLLKALDADITLVDGSAVKLLFMGGGYQIGN
jgi:8-oxo-dGTP diphosphatase